MFVVHPVAPVVQPGGVLNVPPAMVCAAVICPWGKDRFARPSHVVAAGAAVVRDMFRGQPGSAQQMVPVRFSADQHARLRAWCGEHGFSMATVIRGLVDRFLDSQQPEIG